jgi:peptidoglycan/xylan/chitin deacetylase (PgdA/CDA1 family)
LAGGAAVNVIPILLYHSVSDDPAEWIAPFTLSPRAFEAHMDALVEARTSTWTVSELVDALRCKPVQLPDRLVLVTFDDGFADFSEAALEAMAARGIRSTLYITTGFTDAGRGPRGDPMLDWSGLAELDALGVELGGHTHTHPQLDTLSRARAREEIGHCKVLLEQRLGKRTRSFAYPHGYSGPAVRRLVREAGFDSACGVGNALSHPRDDQFGLARLMARATTSKADVAAWIAGTGAPLAPHHDRLRTRAWRLYRRVGVATGVRSERDVSLGLS